MTQTLLPVDDFTRVLIVPAPAPQPCPDRMHQYVCIGRVGRGIYRYRCDRCGHAFDVDSSD